MASFRPVAPLCLRLTSKSWWCLWKLKFRCHMLHTQSWWPFWPVYYGKPGIHCPWVPLHIVLCQRDLLKGDLRTTHVLAAWKASPFPEVAEVCSVWAQVAFPKQWVHGWDVCSTYWVLCCCCVAIRRHLKCFFLGALFKNLFLWSRVLFICLQLSSPFFPVRKQKLSVDIRTQQGLSQGRLILIICMMFVSRNPSELGDVLTVSKNKSWLTLMYLTSNYKKKPSFFSFSDVQRPLCNAPFLFFNLSLVIRFGDSIPVTVPLAFCCSLRLFPV